jgi:hypothetical protein
MCSAFCPTFNTNSSALMLSFLLFIFFSYCHTTYLSHYCVLLVPLTTVYQGTVTAHIQSAEDLMLHFSSTNNITSRVKTCVPVLLNLETRNLIFQKNKLLPRNKVWPQTLQQHRIYNLHPWITKFNQHLLHKYTLNSD